MGVEISTEGLTKSFGRQNIWRDVSLTLPAGEISVLLGPSGTGKSVFLKSVIGLLKPDRGTCLVDGVDVVTCPERDLYEIRKLFGVLFQDGALFGSSFSSTIRPISASLFLVCSRSGKATLSYTVMEPNRAPSWNSTPNSLRIS